MLVGFMGDDRRIGFFGAMVASFFFSPLFGILLTLLSKDLQTDAVEKGLLNYLKGSVPLSELGEVKTSKPTVEDFERIEKARDNGTMSMQEYEKARDELFAAGKNNG